MEKETEKIRKQLNRIKGQINGIEKMIQGERESSDIVNQISAVREALSSLAKNLLREECEECLEQKSNQAKIEKFEEILSNVLKIT